MVGVFRFAGKTTDEESTQIEDPNLTTLQGVVLFLFFQFSAELGLLSVEVLYIWL